MDICTFFNETWVLILIMFTAGVFGGIVNHFQTATPENRKQTWHISKCIIIGLGASYLVPLFLKMISSDLLNSANPEHHLNLLIFFGICLVSAIFSRRFIDSIGERILKEAKEAKQDAEEAKQGVEEAKQEAEEKLELNENVLTAIKDTMEKFQNILIEKAEGNGNTNDK